MSKEKSIKAKSTTTNVKTKRAVSRPKKTDKTTVTVVAPEEPQSKQGPVSVAVPKSVYKFAVAKSKSFKIDGAVESKEPTNHDVIKAIKGLEKSFTVEAASVQRQLTALNDNLDFGIRSLTDIKRAVNHLGSRRSVWPWRNR